MYFSKTKTKKRKSNLFPQISLKGFEEKGKEKEEEESELIPPPQIAEEKEKKSSKHKRRNKRKQSSSLRWRFDSAEKKDWAAEINKQEPQNQELSKDARKFENQEIISTEHTLATTTTTTTQQKPSPNNLKVRRAISEKNNVVHQVFYLLAKEADDKERPDQELIQTLYKKIAALPAISPEEYHYRALAKLHTKPHDARGAIMDLEEVIKKNPKSSSAYVTLAKANILLHKVNKAIAAYTNAINITTPESSEIIQLYCKRSKLYKRQKKYKQALQDLNAVITLLKTNHDYKYAHKVYLAKGTIHEMQEENDDALKSYEEALRLKTDYSPAKKRLQNLKAIMSSDIQNVNRVNDDGTLQVNISVTPKKMSKLFTKEYSLYCLDTKPGKIIMTYQHAFIFIKDIETLYYAESHLSSDLCEIFISDKKKLINDLIQLLGDNSKIKLSEEKFKQLITDNGGYQPKDVIGSHRKILGKGACGIVYEGTWMIEEENELVPAAIKVFYEKDEIIKTFHDEVTVMANAKSPHIVKFYAACFDKDTHALIMEYMPGGTLERYLMADVIIPWPIHHKIATHVALGLKYLHQRKIVHSDVKPTNILLSLDLKTLATPYKALDTLKVKLADFGVAKQLDSDGHTKWGTTWAGTIEFSELKKHSTQASDVYSFGMICWMQAARKMPFSDYNAKDRQQLIADISKGKKETIPTSHPKNVPGETPSSIKNLIEQCWFKPRKRPEISRVVDKLDEAKEEIDKAYNTSNT